MVKRLHIRQVRALRVLPTHIPFLARGIGHARWAGAFWIHPRSHCIRSDMAQRGDGACCSTALGRERGTVSGSSKPPGIIANESVRAERANVLHCSGANAISVVSWDNAETDAEGGRGRERGNQPRRLQTACFHCERKWPCRACTCIVCAQGPASFPLDHDGTR